MILIWYRKENERCTSDLEIHSFIDEDKLVDELYLQCCRYPSSAFTFLISNSWEGLNLPKTFNLSKLADHFTNSIIVLPDRDWDSKSVEAFKIRQRLQQKLVDRMSKFLELRGTPMKLAYLYNETGICVLDLTRINLVKL